MKIVYVFAVAVCLWAGIAASHCFAINEMPNEPAHSLIESSDTRQDAESLAEAELASLLIRAKYHVASGEMEKAREIYRKAIEKFPRNAYAYLQLASLLLGAEEKDSRIKYLEKAIELDPGMKDAYAILGLSYMDKMETQKAIATYSKAIRNVADNLSFYSNLANAYLSLDKTAEAEDTLREACDRHSDSPQSWLKLINFFLSRRETEKADETFEKALRSTGNSLRLLRDVRGLYLKSRRHEDKALAILVRTLELYPESPRMWLELVRQYLSRGETEKAREAARKATSHLRYDEDLFSSLSALFINAQDWDSAISVLTDATKYHAGSVDIWRALASLYNEKGENHKARECYRKILSMEPTRVQERRFLAISYLTDKDYEAAIKELREAIRIFPKEIRLKVDLANAYLAGGQFEEGEKIYLDLIKARPGKSDLYLLLAGYYLKSTKMDKMQGAIDEAVQLEKNPARQARIFSLMGRAAIEKGMVPLALTLLQQAVSKQPDDASHAYALGKAYLLAPDRERAAELLRKAVELAKPPNPGWLLTLGDTYRALGKKDQAAESFGKAIALLQQACQKDLSNWFKRYQLGQAYESADKTQLAAEAYARCVRLQPENGDLRYKLATVYSELHWHKKAQKQLEKAVELRSPKAEWFLLLGEIYRTLARRAEAAEAFEKAIAVLREEQSKKPQDFRVWAALGEAHSRAKQYADSVETLRKAIELAGEKTDFRLHVALARALESTGEGEASRQEYLQAASLLEKAAEDNPSDDDNYLRLGLVYQRLREFAKSAEAFSKGIELAGGGTSYSPHVALADSTERSGKPEEAQAHYQKAYSLLSERIKEHPDDVDAHYMLANVCDRLDKLEQCEQQYKTVMELDPFFAAAYNNLGYTWIDRNVNLEEGIELVRKALELEPDSGAYIDSLGWGYFKQGKLNEALSELQRALKLESSDPTISDHIGDVYKAKNMIKEAIEYWQKALEMDPYDKKIKEKIDKNRDLPPAVEKDQPEESG